MVFEGTSGMYERIYRFNSKRIRKKQKYANSKCILKNLFCWRSDSGNYDIIYQRPGLKTGVRKDIYRPEIGSGFGEPGGTPPPRIPRSTSPGKRNLKGLFCQLSTDVHLFSYFFCHLILKTQEQIGSSHDASERVFRASRDCSWASRFGFILFLQTYQSVCRTNTSRKTCTVTELQNALIQ